MVSLDSGQVYASGQNASGQLGLGHVQATHAPELVGGALTNKKVIKVCCSTYSQHVMFITAEGQAFMTGANHNWTHGSNDQVNKSSPTLVEGLLAKKRIVNGSVSSTTTSWITCTCSRLLITENESFQMT